ncbi:TPA: haloacid dehalogenase-like hydrolase [Providencia stuartii]|nr:haloacid dehalogenase-like hydrolase [Providencia stuartii]
MKTIYFDVCGTLYSTNTTFHFLKFLHSKQKNYLRLTLCLILMSPIGKILNKLKILSIRKIMIKSLKGLDKISTHKIAEIYVNDILPKYEINNIIRLFNKFIFDKDNKVILISASIDPVIKAIADKYHITYHSSILEVNNDKFSGRLSLDLKGNKKPFFDKKSNSIFYSDNLDDLLCHENVTEYYFINRKNTDIYKYIDLEKAKNIKEIYV